MTTGCWIIVGCTLLVTAIEYLLITDRFCKTRPPGEECENEETDGSEKTIQ